MSDLLVTVYCLYSLFKALCAFLCFSKRIFLSQADAFTKASTKQKKKTATNIDFVFVYFLYLTACFDESCHVLHKVISVCADLRGTVQRKLSKCPDDFHQKGKRVYLLARF